MKKAPDGIDRPALNASTVRLKPDAASKLEIEPDAELKHPRIERRVDLVEVDTIDQHEVRHGVRIRGVEQIGHAGQLVTADAERLVDAEIENRYRVGAVVLDVLREHADGSGPRQGHSVYSRVRETALDAEVGGHADIVGKLVSADQTALP